jgi:hypothetical protein
MSPFYILARAVMLEPSFGLILWKMFALASLVLYPLSLIWAFRDAEKRGRNGLLLAIFVAVTWMIGLFVWMVVRPEKDATAA